jgi:uncharacterized protein YndB with AHSA1/START domain
MRVQAEIDVAAPPELVWDFITDPTRYLHFMNGVTRWEVASEQERGCGARYRMLMRVGSAEVGGLVEIVEHEEPRDLAWTSVTGVDQRGRWRLRERAGGARTHVELRMQYGVAGADRAREPAPLAARAQAPGRARASPRCGGGATGGGAALGAVRITARSIRVSSPLYISECF